MDKGYVTKTLKAHRKVNSCVLAALVSAMFCTSGFATPITVNNFSFEALPAGGLPFGGCGAGCAWSSFSRDSSHSIPGWTQTVFAGDSGQFQPGSHVSNFRFFDYIPDGITIAASDGGIISQTVGATVELGVIYTLQVDQGMRYDYLNPGTSVQLLIGNVPITATGTAPVAGGWSTYTATYTGLAADVGKTITIALHSPGIQGQWDNVRLDASQAAIPVSTPATLPLVGAGLAAWFGVARRKHGRMAKQKYPVS